MAGPRDAGVEVIDYTADPDSDAGESYDVIFDAVGKMPRSRRRALKPGGVFISVKTTTRERREDLVFLRDLSARGAIRPIIDRSYALEEVREAHRYVEAGHKKGNVVITISA